MGSTSIYQGTNSRIINRRRILNDGRCSYGIGLVEVEDSSLYNGSHNVFGLLGLVPHKVLRALALVVGVIQTAARLVTMIFPTISTQLDRLNEGSKR